MEEKKIATDSIKDQIYEILKDEILSGELKSGEKLVEQAIADRFHVSRSPVREAIKQLTGDGLLENITNKGTFVKKPTVQELNEMQEMRELLEVYAVARAVERMTDADREELLHLREEIISSANQKDSVMYLALERRIWTAIIGMAGNAYLADIYGKTYAMISNFSKSVASHMAADYDKPLKERLAIIDAMLDHNSDEVIRVTKEHYQNSSKIFSDALEQAKKQKP